MGKMETSKSKEDLNLNLYEQHIGVSVVDWIGLAQDRYRWRELL
jgi:hypothetical protein